MNEIYVSRFRKIFACSDVNRAILYVLVVAQLAQTSDPSAYFILRNFLIPLLIRTPASSGPKCKITPDISLSGCNL